MELPSLGELIAIVEGVGEIAYRRFGEINLVTDKSDGTPVTPVDIEINHQLAVEAKKRKLGYLGEEGNGDESKRFRLVADSLDGTGAFARGMATATIILTLMEDGRPIMAVIHNPVTKQTWAAKKSGGAWYSTDNSPMQMKATVDRNPTGRWRTAICVWPGVDQPFADFQTRVLSDARFSDQQMGAFGLGGGLIASGLLHGTAISATSAVETLAMSLIVKEAGGVAIDLRGNLIESFELGMHKGKLDFLLPHGAILASNYTVAEALLQLY